MKKVAAVIVLAGLLLADIVHATPSTQIWIPSPDVQPFLVGHIGVDNYFRKGHNDGGERDPNILEVGLTVGLLPFEKLQLEIGGDYLTTAGNPNDRYPWSGNAKLGLREEALFPFSPALAGGIYNVGKARKATDGTLSFVRSGQNIVYGVAAKTIPGPGCSLGRFSGGYYHGSKKALAPDNKGLLLSWDRTISELSDKLWIAVDYMGGENVNGALSFGAAWRFNHNVSLLLGYDKFRKRELSGEDTFTIQIDVDFP
ncbi:hypothetical protein M1B72_09260 [Geomonas paludis]|uniref:Lipoprotein n=1 Tax=Geomonas paludis TaxID=2740185 RepID=A0ABY4LIQ4_9BACT|nr:hypothetical protein [Geomonas paludis]UPU37878.1 hypothetical protein M1B72_09260 [Geomonas paludis]